MTLASGQTMCSYSLLFNDFFWSFMYFSGCFFLLCFRFAVDDCFLELDAKIVEIKVVS